MRARTSGSGAAAGPPWGAGVAAAGRGAPRPCPGYGRDRLAEAVDRTRRPPGWVEWADASFQLEPGSRWRSASTGSRWCWTRRSGSAPFRAHCGSASPWTPRRLPGRRPHPLAGPGSPPLLQVAAGRPVAIEHLSVQPGTPVLSPLAARPPGRRQQRSNLSPGLIGELMAADHATSHIRELAGARTYNRAVRQAPSRPASSDCGRTFGRTSHAASRRRARTGRHRRPPAPLVAPAGRPPRPTGSGPRTGR